MPRLHPHRLMPWAFLRHTPVCQALNLAPCSGHNPLQCTRARISLVPFYMWHTRTHMLSCHVHVTLLACKCAPMCPHPWNSKQCSDAQGCRGRQCTWPRGYSAVTNHADACGCVRAGGTGGMEGEEAERKLKIQEKNHAPTTFHAATEISMDVADMVGVC